MTPLFHPAAEQEVAAALKIGEERGFGLGRELVQEFVAFPLCSASHQLSGSHSIHVTNVFRYASFHLA